MASAAPASNDLDQLAERLIARIHEGGLKDGAIYQGMNDFFNHHLDHAVSLGWHAADPQLRSYLGANVQRFSGFKTYAVQQAMREKLTDAAGNIRPFAAFRTDALQVNQLYNVQYLRTEYEQALAGAQMASKWADFAEGSLLRYDTAGDDHVRQEHAVYDGIVRPKNDPFWDTHYPPCDWGCRCNATEVDDDTAPTPAAELQGLPPVPEEFRPNVGKTGEVFGPEHPYFDVPAKVAQLIEAQLGSPPAATGFVPAHLVRLRQLGVKVTGGSDQVITHLLEQHLPTSNLPQLAGDLKEAAKRLKFTWEQPIFRVKNPAINGEVLNLDYLGTWRKQSVTMARTFYQKDGSLRVSHDLLELPEKLQGKGVSRLLNSAFYEEYQRSGVQAITLHAALDAGGYAWAKAGFAATDQAEVLAILAKAPAQVPSNVVQALQQVVQDHYTAYPNKPFPMERLAQTQYGKTLLSGSSWHGILDLNNAEQMAIFEAYLHPRK